LRANAKRANEKEGSLLRGGRAVVGVCRDGECATDIFEFWERCGGEKFLQPRRGGGEHGGEDYECERRGWEKCGCEKHVQCGFWQQESERGENIPVQRDA